MPHSVKAEVGARHRSSLKSSLNQKVLFRVLMLYLLVDELGQGPYDVKKPASGIEVQILIELGRPL